MKIAVYAIALNEIKFVDRFMASCKGADYIVVADTGSTDGTVERLKELGAIVHSIAVKPWRFDHARNTALCLVPTDADICVSIDLDEVLVEGWREEIVNKWTPNTTRLRYRYNWGQGVEFFYEKIHARNGYWWHHPCHEYPGADPRTTETYAQTERLLVKHLPDPTKSRGSYLSLLEVGVKEDPRCVRNSFYYARELMFNQQPAEAIKEIDRWFSLEQPTWYYEKSYMHRIKADCMEVQGQIVAAEASYKASVQAAPDLRDPYLHLARYYYRRKMWAECLAACESALAITERKFVHTTTNEPWGEAFYDMASLACYYLMQGKQALEYIHKAIEINHNDTRLKDNLEWILKLQGAQDAST
jgi:glycosyltransferase involved in cell wall biosynthesis